MKRIDNQNHSKETRQKNLLTLKEAIDDGSINEISKFTGEWGGSHVIITSSPDKAYDPETDEDDWFGHRSQCTYVLTKHSEELSKLFAYVGENIMGGRDNYLYGFMALSANDFIRRSDDGDERKLLNYVFSGITFYLGCFDWKSAMGNAEKAFEIMRFFLSDEICDDEIRHVL